MQFRKRDFDGRRRPLPPIPAGRFFCRSCSTIRADAERAGGNKQVICRHCVTAASAKYRASIAAKGLTKPRSTKTQSSPATSAPTKSASTKTQSSPATSAPTKSASTKTQSSPG